MNTHIRDNLSYLYTNLPVGGAVASDGTRLSGNLFSSVRNSVGDYTLTFSPVLSASAAVAVTPLNVSAAISPTVISVGTATVNLRVYNAASSLTDAAFVFVATPMT